MANGTLTKNVGSYNRFRLAWSSTTNAANNSSTLTTQLYWETIGNVGGVSASNKTVSLTVNGTTRSATFASSLTAGQSRLIMNETWTIPHNADGGKSVSIAFSSALNVTLSGKYHGTVSHSGTAIMDNIAKASTGRILESFTVPSNPRISIASSNSNYTHTVDLEVDYNGSSQVIATRTGLAAGNHTFSLVSSENEKIVNFNRINPTYFASRVRIRIKTYSGSTLIGSYLQEAYTEVRTPEATTAGITNSGDIKVSDTLQISYSSRASNTLCHWLELSTSPSSGVFFQANIGASVVNTTVNLNLFRDEIMAAMGNNSSVTLYLRTHTFYNVSDGVDPFKNKVRNVTSTPFTVKIDNPPTWGTTAFTYADTATSVTAITGSNKILVRGKSTARVSFPSVSLATGQNGATISSYTFTLGTFTQTWTAANMPSYVDVPITSLMSNASAQLVATDSRGSNSAPKSISLTIYNYYAPSITSTTAKRSGTSPTTVQISINGGHAPLNDDRNYPTFVRWSTTPNSFPTGNTLTITKRSGTWTATGNITISDEVAQMIYFQVLDRFNGVATSSAFVDKVQPILFMDAINSRVGIGKLNPAHALDVEGKIVGTSFGALNTKNDVHVFEVDSSRTVPLLTLKGYQDTSTLLIDSFPTNYSSRLGFARQGTETAYIERNYSGDKFNIYSQTSINIDSGEDIVMGSTVVAEQGIELAGGTIDLGNNFNAMGFYTSNGQPAFGQVANVTITMKATERASYVDITFPKAFPNGILGVFAQPINSQSNTYKSSVFNQTKTGCRIYSTHIDDIKAANTVTMVYIAIGW